MVKTFDLSGKVVLLTGGYGFLGKAITESLVFHGATVYVLGRSSEKFLTAFDNHPEKDKKLNFRLCDVSDTKSISKAYIDIFESEGKIDVQINNAFYLKGQNPLSMSDDDWSNGIEGTLSSVFKCIREGIPYLTKSKSPRIINVSSMYGMVAPEFEVYGDFPRFLNPPHYGAAKAGVIQLTKYYASFLGDRGITVNSISPGPFPNETVKKSEGFVQQLMDRTCLKRVGNPEDLAGAFVFLASDAAEFITGQNIVVDGGWTST